MADISSLQSVQANHEKYAYLFEDSKNGDMINTETFFNLLMAEMGNQDPLEPMSNTEFVSQMAQFTALQAQQDNLKYSMSNYASTLVGKTLTLNAQTNEGALVSGVCTGINIKGSDVKVVVDDTQYSLSAIMAVTENKKPESTDVTSASAFIGKEVTVRVLGEDGKYYYDKGIVDAVEVSDNNARIVINDYVYDVSEIIFVKEPSSETDGAGNEEADGEEVLNRLMDIVGH